MLKLSSAESGGRPLQDVPDVDRIPRPDRVRVIDPRHVHKGRSNTAAESDRILEPLARNQLRLTPSPRNRGRRTNQVR